MRYSIVWCVLGLAVCFAGVSSYGERVFVADRGGAKVVALGVDENMEFSFLKRWSFNTVSTYGLGPLDLGVDEARGIMFVSFETVNSAGQKMATCKIALIDINTYEHIKDIEFAEADDFGGLAYDSQRERVYAVERDTNLLYVLKWTPQTLSLEYEAVVELSSIMYACAIVVDGGSAYITEFRYRNGMAYYDHIKEYDISNGWRYVRTIPNWDKSTCLAYDSAVKIFYSGAYDYAGSYHHMIKHVMDPNEVLVKDIGNCMIDGDVDAATGHVYITTYNGAGVGQWGNVQVWDTSEWTDDPNQAIAPIAGYVYDPNGPSSEMLYGPAGVLFVEHDARPITLDIIKDDGLNEEDPNDFVLPDDEIVYTITIDPNNANHEWMTVTDLLPAGVDYDYFDLETMTIDPNYDPQTHTYTWELGPVSAGAGPIVLTLTVTVNDRAEPAGVLVNEVIVESDIGFGVAYEHTPVACFGGDIIYVAAAAGEGGNGTSWLLAYRELSDAVARADGGCGDEEVWVARGTYKPGPRVTDSFVVPDAVSVYGGFAGNETSIEQRDFAGNPTILSGYIRTINDIEERNETVVTMGDDSLLDGVIVTGSGREGIYGSGADFVVTNCTVSHNVEDGVYCLNGDVVISWCVVEENGHDGIHHVGNSYVMTVENCKLIRNARNGIYSLHSIPMITNCMIYENGSEFTGYYGLSINQASSNPAIHNCTIVHNDNESIGFTGTYLPDVRNCILWGNNNDGSQLAGLEVYEVYFSCIPDCNDVNPEGNINENPRFAYSYPEYGYYHLASDSNCIDAGDTYEKISELDIDADDRVNGSDVDMGADEYACGEVSNASDITGDGIINFKDFGILAGAWGSHDPNDPSITSDPNFINEPNYIDAGAFVKWDGRVDYDADYEIELGDLAYFAEEAYWLWMACWRESWEGLWMMEGAMMQATYPLQSIAIEPVLPQDAKTEPTIDEQYAHAKNVTESLEELWANDDEIKKVIGKKDWEEFMGAVYDWLSEIETVYDER